MVAKIFDAADGADESAVIRCLVYLHNERGLKAGTDCGPQYWSWFLTVVENEFADHAARFAAGHPEGSEWQEREREEVPF
jgi:hypothetical protein